jgi:hypothetical protein
MFATIHEKTLIDVTTLLVGPQATAAILAVYQLVDKAQAEAYELGTHDAQQVFAATQDQAWDAGYEQAERDNNADAAYDTGYITGVADARARPAEADENVAEIVEAAAEEAYEDEGTAEEWCDECQDYHI